MCAVDGCEKPRRASNGMCGAHYQHWKRYGTAETLPRSTCCTVAGCGKPTKRTLTGLCEMHYYRKRRTGSLELAERPLKFPLPPTARTKTPNEPRPTECQEPGCGKPIGGRNWCNMHYTRWLRHGDPQTVIVDRNLPTGSAHPHWRGDEAGYRAVHERVRSRRGPAKDHPCLHCGGQAAHWAYDHADPAELIDSAMGPYSTNPERYLPLCVSCHKRFDLAHLASAVR